MALFDPRVKTPLHIVYILFVIAAMSLSVPRLFMKNQPRTRANTIALGMVYSPPPLLALRYVDYKAYTNPRALNL
jgi:hypothetical protein